MDNKVAIILSAYNGEEFISEQIESILAQSFNNLDLFVHDDGSSDETFKIIKEYADKYENINIIVDKKKLGYPECFIEMLKVVEGYQYYAFCDQDDVWSKDKIANGVEALKSLDNKRPLLYYTAVNYCDSYLNFIRGSRFAEKIDGLTYLSLTDVLFGGEAMGMTFIFNNRSRDALITANEYGKFKDWFLKIYCSTCGNIIYDPKPSAMYRRHNRAVTEKSNPSGKIRRYCSQIQEIFLSKETFCEQKKIISLLKTIYFDDISKEDQQLLRLFSAPDSIMNRIKKVFYKKRFRRKLIDEFGYRFAFLLGKI